MGVDDLEGRVGKLEQAVAAFSGELRLALRYIDSDGHILETDVGLKPTELTKPSLAQSERRLALPRLRPRPGLSLTSA